MADDELRILVIEDDEAIAGLVTTTLRRAGHLVQSAGTAADGLAALTDFEPHIVVLDLGLPDQDGLDVLKELRDRHRNLGIICLTARTEEIDRVLGFEFGADDYVTKPFSPREFSGRVKALGRRVAAPPPTPTETIELGTVEINRQRREITVDGEVVDFTRMEFDLVGYLADHRGDVCTRMDLLETVWGHSWLGSSRTVDVHVAQVRRKFGDAITITTVRGVGYRLE